MRLMRKFSIVGFIEGLLQRSKSYIVSGSIGFATDSDRNNFDPNDQIPAK